MVKLLLNAETSTTKCFAQKKTTRITIFGIECGGVFTSTQLTRKHPAQDIIKYKTSKKLTEVRSVLEQYIKLRSLSTVFQLDKQAPDAEFAKQVNSNHSKLISFFFKY